MLYRSGRIAVLILGLTVLGSIWNTGSAQGQTDGAEASAKATIAAQSVIRISLTLNPTVLNSDGMQKLHIGYMPVPIRLTARRPANISKEPAYAGKPYYGVITLGNGPRSTFILAIDTTTDGDSKIYVDKNQDGDLTNDGDGAWAIKTHHNGIAHYEGNDYVLRASWGEKGHEISSGQYGVSLYCTVSPGKEPQICMFREGAREGKIPVGDKLHDVLLVENDADALYSKPIHTDQDGKPYGVIKSGPVWLLVDLNDDGNYKLADIRAPFKLDDKTYEARVAEDGSELQLTETTKTAADLAPKPAPRQSITRVAPPKQSPLLPAGFEAPNFRAIRPDGDSVQLSDYRGKVLVLDFWATWCGPCLQAMPHLERIYQALRGKDADVLAICVWDQKSWFDAWLPQHKSDYTFSMAFDPAAKDRESSIATRLFLVSRIPTTYVIGKDGKVVDAIVGYDPDDDRVEAALKKAGIDIETQTARL
jgi:thiol-disulfide isomerase/thioredoxin